jgi:hypothetical protein
VRQVDNDVAIILGIISLISFSPTFMLFSKKGLTYGFGILHWVLNNKIVRIPIPKQFGGFGAEKEDILKSCRRVPKRRI